MYMYSLVSELVTYALVRVRALLVYRIVQLDSS